jgi:hypothetical protein
MDRGGRRWRGLCRYDDGLEKEFKGGACLHAIQSRLSLQGSVRRCISTNYGIIRGLCRLIFTLALKETRGATCSRANACSGSPFGRWFGEDGHGGDGGRGGRAREGGFYTRPEGANAETVVR